LKTARISRSELLWWLVAPALNYEAPAAQTVNRAAKGDKLKSPPQADPEKATTPDGRGAPVITAGQYEVVAATLASVNRSIPDPLFTLRILPEGELIATDGRRS